VLYRLPTGGTLPAPLFDIINRALANTKVGPGEVEDINTRPLGCQGGSTRWNERHCIMYRHRMGPGPTATAGTSVDNRTSGPDRNGPWWAQYGGEALRMAKSSKPREGESRKEEWPNSPGSDEQGGNDRKTRPGAAQRCPQATWEYSLNTQPRCRLEAARVTIHPVNDWSSQRWRRLPWQSRERTAKRSPLPLPD